MYCNSFLTPSLPKQYENRGILEECPDFGNTPLYPAAVPTFFERKPENADFYAPTTENITPAIIRKAIIPAKIRTSKVLLSIFLDLSSVLPAFCFLAEDTDLFPFFCFKLKPPAILFAEKDDLFPGHDLC